MGMITVHAGDFIKGKHHSFYVGAFTLKSDILQWNGERIPVDQVANIEVASEDNVKKMGSAAAWGTVGALTLGPVGLLAGVLAGGNKKEVTFIAEFKDGRRILATTDSKTFTKIRAAMFSPRPNEPVPKEVTPQQSAPTEQPEQPAPEPISDARMMKYLALVFLPFVAVVVLILVMTPSDKARVTPVVVAPAVNQPTDDAVVKAIRTSDDFESNKEAFIKGAKELVSQKACSLSAIEDAGGWTRSVGDPARQTYFTYCGSPTFANRWYINMPSGRVYQRKN